MEKTICGRCQLDVELPLIYIEANGIGIEICKGCISQIFYTVKCPILVDQEKTNDKFTK